MAVRTRRQAGAILAVLALAALGGCSGGDDGTTLVRDDLPRLVLQSGDLSGAWSRFDDGPLLRADLPVGERGDPGRFGRVDGWKARFRRGGDASSRGPLLVESRADLFEDADGAEQDFDAAVRELESRFDRTVDAPPLGDEVQAAAAGTETAGTARTFAVVWREESVVAVVVAQGFAGRFELDDVVALARKQQARIERAAGPG